MAIRADIRVYYVLFRIIEYRYQVELLKIIEYRIQILVITTDD